MFSSNNPTAFPENTLQDRSRTHFALPLYIYIRSRCYQKAWYCQIEVDLSWRRLAFSFSEFLPIQSEPPRPSRPSLDLHPDCLSASINSEIQKSKIRRFCKFDCRRNRNIVTRPSSQWGNQVLMQFQATQTCMTGSFKHATTRGNNFVSREEQSKQCSTSSRACRNEQPNKPIKKRMSVSQSVNFP